MTRSKIFCCAKNCYNYQQAPNAPTFFSFPKDIVSRAQWAENAGRPDLIPKSYASFLGRYFLCADHFEPECFTCPKRKHLLKRNTNPIPTIFENNLSTVLPLRNSRTDEDIPGTGIATLANTLDCPENLVDTNGSELSSIVTVELAPNNLVCSLSDEANELTIATVAPAQESIQMECLMLCRLCASLIEVSLLLPIFNDTSVPSINQMVEQFLPGKVIVEDGLPQHICSSCMERLRVCYESVELFQSADARLREMLQLCSLNGSLNGDAAKSSQSPEGVLSAFNLEPPSKPDNVILDEPATMLTTVGLVAIEPKEAENEEEGEEDEEEEELVAVLDGASDLEEAADDGDADAAVTGSDDLDSFMTACNVCLKSLPSRSALLLHYFSSHTLILKEPSQPAVSYQCTLCDQVVANKKSLKQHLATHMPTHFVCIKCEKRFKSWAHLKKHVHACHQTGDLKVSPLPDRLEKDLKCSQCGKEFKNRASLKKHQSTHSSDRNVLCCLCGKVLANVNSLRVHMRTHSEDRPYSCQECGKCFKGSTELRSHSITHTREKVFDCSQCGRKFHSKSLVRQHMLSHTRDKPHKCNLCPAAFNRLGNLNQHKKKHVNGRAAVDVPVTHECHICSKRFQSELTLKYHVAKHTGEKHPFDCAVCGKRFIALDPYRVHMRIHTGERPYECSVCKKTFRSSATLKQHAGLHRDHFPYACPFCQRTFKRLQSLIVHKKTHTGEKPYPCPLCGRPFAQKGDMLKHTKTHRTGTAADTGTGTATQIEGESVIMEINSIHDLALSETDITNEFLMSMPIVKVEMS